MSANTHHIGGLHLGQVTDNDDPGSRGRLKVNIASIGLELWCQATTPSAGLGEGMQLEVMPGKDQSSSPVSRS